LIDLHNVVTLDWETYFDQKYSLRSKDYNTSEYIRDPQFKPHCVGIKMGLQPTKVYWEEEIEPALREIKWGRKSLLCHHTAFDGFILSHHYGIVPKFYLDTMSMARAMHSTQSRASLDAVASLYGVGNKMPNVLGKMKGLREIPQELRADATAYTKMDVDLCFVIFSAMLKVFPQEELELIDRTIRMFCTPMLEVDIPRVQEELRREIADKEAKVAACGFDVTELQSAAKLASVLEGLGVTPPKKISPRTELETYAFSLQDEEFLALGTHPDPKVRAVIEARIAVKSTLGESRAMRFLKAGANGAKLPVYLNYCGAHTTRWSGGNKLNLQNLPRGGELRKAIRAPKGHVLVVCDSAQIEARVLAWIAKQEDVLVAFRDKRDVYRELASEIYGLPLDKISKEQRFVGKVARLGLGYGMGWRKFKAVLELGLMGPPVVISEDEAKRIVNVFRRKNPFIRAFWRRGDEVLEAMYLKAMSRNDCFATFVEGVLEYDATSIWLPNGLPMHYPNLKADYDDNTGRLTNFTYKSHADYNKIYGGLLVENVVQALARVVVGQQLLKISNRYFVATMSHDEVVAVAPEAEADQCLSFMMETMRTPPAWGLDIPLDAEGGYDVLYSK
jgi:hypothetical protein